MKSVVLFLLCVLGAVSSASAAYLNLDQSAFTTPTMVRVQILNNLHVLIEGDFTFTTEVSGNITRKAIRTNVPNTPVVIRMAPDSETDAVLPLAAVVSLYARANAGEECYVPSFTYCGINTFDYTCFCQEEHPLSVDQNGCYWNVYATNSPLSEFLPLHVELRNMKFWLFSIIEQSLPRPDGPLGLVDFWNTILDDGATRQEIRAVNDLLSRYSTTPE